MEWVLVINGSAFIIGPAEDFTSPTPDPENNHPSPHCKDKTPRTSQTWRLSLSSPQRPTPKESDRGWVPVCFLCPSLANFTQSRWRANWLRMSGEFVLHWKISHCPFNNCILATPWQPPTTNKTFTLSRPKHKNHYKPAFVFCLSCLNFQRKYCAYWNIYVIPVLLRYNKHKKMRLVKKEDSTLRKK